MEKQTFAGLMREFQYRHDSRQVFNDFLTMSICALGQDYSTGKSVDEELYLQTIAKYKQDNLASKFPELFALLVTEMEERLESGFGNDVLGDFYEQNLYEKGKSQYFTPWPICQFMASIAMPLEGVEIEKLDRPLRIIDPCCGSGRLLLAGTRTNGKGHDYYGIDLDHTCVQMTVLNLFLNGVFTAEVMHANALMPDDFRVSYRTSRFPLGVYRITEKEKSKLWHLNINSFRKEKPVPVEQKPIEFPENYTGTIGSQLTLF